MISTLIGAISSVEVSTLEGTMNTAFMKQPGTDNHLAQLVTSALSGAPPGEISVPAAVKGVTKEGDKETTNGHTYKNYQYFWKFVCAFTKWTPTN